MPTTIPKTKIRDARLNNEDQAALSNIGEILSDVRAGKPVIIVDDEDRENEGDLIIAAEKTTPEAINFMAKDGRGLICLPMETQMIDRLGLELMGRGDNTHHRTAFTVSIEAKEGVTTGISAADRSHTILTAIDPLKGSNDIATPGHVFPLKAKDGGVLVRAGHTEAAVDLSKMAGFSGAGVICEIMNDDGTMARLPDLIGFAQKHGLKIGTIADLISYRRQKEKLVECTYDGSFTHKLYEGFNLRTYSNTLNSIEHIALIKGEIHKSDDPVLVRMHALDYTNDILGAAEDSDLQKSMRAIHEEGAGIIVIIRQSVDTPLSKMHFSQSNSGIDKNNVLKDYGIGAQILKDLGVREMILLSNSQKNIAGLEGYNLHISGQRSL